MALQWGDVPAWVGAILTSGSVFAAYWTLRRAQQRAERQQADQVHVVLDMHDLESPEVGRGGTATIHSEGTVTIHNRSTAPIYLVHPKLALIERRDYRDTHRSYWRPRVYLQRKGEFLPRIPYLLNGWKVPVSVRSTQSTSATKAIVEFRDSAGRFWWRTTEGDTIPSPLGRLTDWTEEAKPGLPTPVKDE